LTGKGRKVIDAATATRFAEAAGALPDMPPADRHALAALLRRWLARYD
jgi:hypothetical protein